MIPSNHKHTVDTSEGRENVFPPVTGADPALLPPRQAARQHLGELVLSAMAALATVNAYPMTSHAYAKGEMSATVRAIGCVLKYHYGEAYEEAILTARDLIEDQVGEMSIQDPAWDQNKHFMREAVVHALVDPPEENLIG